MDIKLFGPLERGNRSSLGKEVRPEVGTVAGDGLVGV
jgi:hypothetical protein